LDYEIRRDSASTKHTNKYIVIGSFDSIVGAYNDKGAAHRRKQVVEKELFYATVWIEDLTLDKGCKINT